MRVIYFTSGAGSTAEYILSNSLKPFDNGLSNILNVGLVYEPNEKIDERLKNMNRYLINNDNGKSNKVQVIRSQFENNEDFHEFIWHSIKDLRADVIFLLGWMHIVPGSFISKVEGTGGRIVNLHPTLQYQLIGRDIYPKIWEMYQDGMIRETGCMVHYVSKQLDRGELIYEMRLDLTKCKTFDDYHKQMYGDFKDNVVGLEKQCVYNALMKLYEKHSKNNEEVVDISPNSFIKVNNLKLKHRGKVRDIYESTFYKDYLFVLTSDRISANDIVISYLPQKGYYLNQINAFWHKLFGISQMVCGSNGNLMVIRKMRAIPLEIIIRRRITGSLWKAYAQKGERIFNGYELPEGMTEGDLFEEPIITPTTKGTHDIPITFEEIVQRGILNRAEINIIREKSIGLFKMGEAYMKRIGIEMIDTKFEFAFDSYGNIELIDEIFTPDSSRFIVDGTRMDKDILRRWATENEAMILSHPPGNDGCRGVKLPEEVRDKLIRNYKGFLEKLYMDKINYRCIDMDSYSDTLPEVLNKLSQFVIILAGSKSDFAHVEKIRTELAKKDIIAFVYYYSAHKNTETVISILQANEYNRSSKIIYITVAGLSNALSGVVACNVSRPVLACPPFSDKADYSVNIHSTIQMPSGVPSACIIRPDNVAEFCRRIFDN